MNCQVQSSTLQQNSNMINNHYFPDTWGNQSIQCTAPVGSNAYFQGHLHCHPSFEELLNRSLLNRGSATKTQHGRRGRKKQSMLYLNL